MGWSWHQPPNLQIGQASFEPLLCQKEQKLQDKDRKPRPKFFMRALSIESRIGEHDLEHKFAVSNVELEVEDRGMKIVVQIVVQILRKYVWSRLWFGVLGLRV